MVVVARNVCAQQEQNKLSGGKMKENLTFKQDKSHYKRDEMTPNDYSLSFLKVGTMTDFLSTAGLPLLNII